MVFRHNLTHTALLAAAALLAPVALAAQTTGAIAGTVRDAVTGKGIRLARVALDNGGNFATADTSGG